MYTIFIPIIWSDFPCVLKFVSSIGFVLHSLASIVNPFFLSSTSNSTHEVEAIFRARLAKQLQIIDKKKKVTITPFSFFLLTYFFSYLILHSCFLSSSPVPWPASTLSVMIMPTCGGGLARLPVCTRSLMPQWPSSRKGSMGANHTSTRVGAHWC